MSGSESGANAAGAGAGQGVENVSPGRPMSTRSASPAKRSRADMDMEDAEQKHVPGASQQTQRMPTSFASDSQGTGDVDMAGMTPASDSSNTQESATNGSMAVGEAMDTSATSFRSEDGAPPPYKATDDYSTEEIDEQVSQMEELANRALDEGARGVVMSNRWLSRVLSRATKNLKSNEYRKSDREGAVGPLDNSDIVPPGAFDDPLLNDGEGKPYIPLNPGLVIGQDITILPFEAYGQITGKYGAMSGQKAIIRYAHNTATDPDAVSKNIIYELYPLIITVQKVPWREPNAEKPVKGKTAFGELKKRQERLTRGQHTPDDAPILVSSRSEKVQQFLRRAKEAVEVTNGTKVKVWRVLEQAQSDSNGSGVATPPASRSPSPAKSEATKLVVDQSSFEKMEIGKELEYSDVMEDQTLNEKYNGRATMDLTGLGAVTAATILLEEQTGGPAGGEFTSDSKKGFKSIMSHLNRKSNGSKSSSTTASGRTSPNPGMMTRGRMRKDGRTRGVVGLSNLGNTCYMNSALQCIRSVEELAVYFLSKKYKKEINNDNPLGHHGAMANAYFTVLAGIYGDSSGGSYTPKEFKNKLGSIQPLFSGYGQQDSQEFLSFLVDALHEDLNRIIKKPYIENPDSDDAKVHDPEYVHELGETYRANHQKRNNSIATDLFGGFYKNTMECPDCEKVSVTFDPYSLLTVQLPMDHAFQHTITFIPLHGKPFNHEIDMDKNSTVKTLKESIAKKHRTDAGRLWMAEVYSHKIYKAFADNITLADANIQPNDYIFIFELEHSPNNAPSGKKSYTAYGTTKDVDVIPVEGMESPQADVFAVPIFSRAKSNTGSTANQALHPLYITLTRDEAKDYEVVIKKVLLAVANVTSRPILTEFHEGEVKKGDVEEVDEDTEMVKDQTNSDDTAGVSDHSAQSEDGYVAITLDKTDSSAAPAEATGSTDDEFSTPIPDGFMDAQYFIPDALRHQLFDLKWVKSSDGNLHCASMSSSFANDVRPMFDRVKQPERRASTDSSNSNDSVGSGHHANESDGSDVNGGIDDDPDIRLGGQDETTTSSPDAEENDEGASLSSNQTQSQPGGKRKKNKRRRKGNKKGSWKAQGRTGGQHAYGNRNNRQNGFRQHGSHTGGDSDDGNPYYIQLGEAIVLDWQPDAYDSLFMGDENDAEEMRGHVYHSDDGKNGRVFTDPELEARKQKRSERKKHGIDLEDCFMETGKREILSEDNAWYCNRCKEMRRAAKTLQIWTLPDILVVHMKRFGGTRSFRDKIDVLVDYPIEGLDMNDKVGLKEVDKDYTYDLFAVDNHYGGLGGGHYTAMAKNFNDGEWYDYNDSITSKIGSGAGKLKSAAAYLLFYRRRSEKALGPQYLQDLVMESRNPPAVSAADDIDEADSGEDKLGGPAHSSSRGSSSALAVAGAGMTSRQNRAGNGGTGADSNRTAKTMKTNEEISEMIFGGSTGWGFDNINGEAGKNDSDAESTEVQMDADDGDSGLGVSVGSDSESRRTGTRNSSHEDMSEYEEVPGMGMMDRDDEGPTVEVHLPSTHDATQEG